MLKSPKFPYKPPQISSQNPSNFVKTPFHHKTPQILLKPHKFHHKPPQILLKPHTFCFKKPINFIYPLKILLLKPPTPQIPICKKTTCKIPFKKKPSNSVTNSSQILVKKKKKKSTQRSNFLKKTPAHPKISAYREERLHFPHIVFKSKKKTKNKNKKNFKFWFKNPPQFLV